MLLLTHKKRLICLIFGQIASDPFSLWIIWGFGSKSCAQNLILGLIFVSLSSMEASMLLDNNGEVLGFSIYIYTKLQGQEKEAA